MLGCLCRILLIVGNVVIIFVQVPSSLSFVIVIVVDRYRDHRRSCSVVVSSAIDT